jgi:hypothetical protein
LLFIKMNTIAMHICRFALGPEFSFGCHSFIFLSKIRITQANYVKIDLMPYLRTVLIKSNKCIAALRPNRYSKLKNAKIFVSPISRGWSKNFRIILNFENMTTL